MNIINGIEYVIKRIVLAALLILPLTAAAQQTVAIGHFENKSGRFFLDDWERQIPDYLQDRLSGKTGIILVARKDLKTVLDEHALSMTGRIDSSMARLIGRLLSARYLITGAIHSSRQGVRIDVHIIHTATGRMVAEKSSAPGADHLDKMTQMLADNIAFQLTGNGVYCPRIALKQYPTGYVAAGTTLSLLSTLILHADFKNRQNDYRTASGLADFDPAYESANRSFKARNVMMVLTGIGAAGTLYCWLKNLSPQAVTASAPPVQPHFSLNKEEVRLGLTLRF